MEIIERKDYLNKLISRKENGMIKILTGIRRCGKSFMLDPIFKDYLLKSGVKKDHIIKVDLETIENEKYLDPIELNNYIKGKIEDNDIYYILIDEIQKVNNFEAVLNGFLHEKNLDVYVTGSNSRFLSSDIITEFRGRGDEIRVFPLSFSEFAETYSDKNKVWNEYVTYGGMPLILNQKTTEQKSKYLTSLFELTYKKDIIERNNIAKDDVLDSLINILSSSIGSLTNPQKIYNTFVSNGITDLSKNTVISYIDYLLDSFLIEKVERYDVKWKKYIQTPQKYYFADIGLRNARLNFRQQEENHLMENIIYNELVVRGYNVDVGVVEIRDDESIRKQLEVDFVCNQGSKRYYIQVALNLDTPEKTAQEAKSLNNIGDSFKKIIIVKDNINLWRNDDGILIIGIQEFLLNKNSLDL